MGDLPLCSRVLEHPEELHNFILIQAKNQSKIQKCFVKTTKVFDDIQMKKEKETTGLKPFPFFPALYNTSHWMSLGEVQRRSRNSGVPPLCKANLWTSLLKKVTESTAVTG